MSLFRFFNPRYLRIFGNGVYFCDGFHFSSEGINQERVIHVLCECDAPVSVGSKSLRKYNGKGNTAVLM